MYLSSSSSVSLPIVQVPYCGRCCCCLCAACVNCCTSCLSGTPLAIPAPRNCLASGGSCSMICSTCDMTCSTLPPSCPCACPSAGAPPSPWPGPPRCICCAVPSTMIFHSSG